MHHNGRRPDCEKAASANLGRLMRLVVPEEHVAEAVREIEHQLSFVSREQPREHLRDRYPERVVFTQFEAWKRSRGGAR